jgi:hypothetical protein
MFRHILFISFILVTNTAIGQVNSSSDELIRSVVDKSDSFKIYYKKRKIPRPVRHKLHELTGSRFRIANPGKKYQATDMITSLYRLPWRRLNFIAIYGDLCVIDYNHGGRGHHTHTALMRLKNHEVVEVYDLRVFAREHEFETVARLLKEGHFSVSNCKAGCEL